ncbi:MAG TPA: ABC transporter substrate-binding protein [Candidatus Limnocylindrales bacterium]|nr:ABC transporter substrate-binding protein [Candidatus Limnocylindrales bacterium]
MKIAWNSTPDLSYLPLLMAIDDLKSQGYNISAAQLTSSDLVFQSLAGNQVQFTADTLAIGALAASKGAPIKVIGTRNADLVTWVTLKDNTDCTKLDGKPVGIYSQTSGYTLLMNLYFKANCPDIKPTLVTIPDSPLRAKAIVSGEIEGSTLGLPDAITIDKASPGKLAITYFGQDMPGLADDYVFTNADTIKDHGSIVTAFLEAQLKAIRSLYQDPTQIAGLVAKYLPESGDVSDIATQFIDKQLWYANGGLASDGLQKTLEAFDIPTTRDQVLDDSPMKAALAAIGQSDATKY